MVKGEWGKLRRPEGEGCRRRAVEAGVRGRPEDREGERRLGRRPDGEQRGVVRGGRRERSGVGRGDFLVIF